MAIKTAVANDRREHVYSEFQMGAEGQPSADETIRVTYIPDPSWTDEPTIRIQKRGADGHLFQGEEFAASRVIHLLKAITDVLPGG